jgi:hypothetical protein
MLEGMLRRPRGCALGYASPHVPNSQCPSDALVIFPGLAM